MINILMVDDHLILREGIKRIIDDTPDIKIVAEASSGQEAMDLIWENKYDLWKDEYEYNGNIQDHPIFEPFKFGMQRLQERGIPTYRYIVSAKSDPEMVYRGVLTMVDDY